MKKNKMFLAIALCVCCLGGTYYFNGVEEKDAKEEMLLENIEALSDLESGEDLDLEYLCSGPAFYSEIGMTKTVKTVRHHYNDSIDLEQDFEMKYCYADGCGHKRGMNGMAVAPKPIGNIKEVKCEGNQYHNGL